MNRFPSLGFLIAASLFFACQPRPEPLASGDAAEHGVPSQGLGSSYNPVPLTQESLDAGKKTYQLACMACHSATGAPGPTIAMRPTAPHFNRPEWSRSRSDTELYLTIQMGRPMKGMPSWKHLRPRETWSIIHFIRSLSGTAEEFAQAAEKAANATSQDSPEGASTP